MKKKNEKKYDKASKDLLDIFQIDIVSFFTGVEPENITFEGTELSIPDRSVDSSFKINNEYILNLEFQTKYEKGIEFRMLLYNVLLSLRHKLPVRTILIYLKKHKDETIKSHYTEICFGTSIHFNFEVIKIWELDTEKILSQKNYALYPFAAVSKKDPELVDKIYNRILESPFPKEKKGRLLSSLSALLNLYYEQEDIKVMLKQLPKFDIIEEWKKDYKNEVLNEVLAEKNKILAEKNKILAEGKLEGKLEGLNEGEYKKSIKIATEMLKEGFEIKVISRLTGLSEEEVEGLK